MLEKYTDEQLLSHLAGLGEWTRIRAQELKYFCEHLPARHAAAAGNPRQQESLRYALNTYIGAVEEISRRCREAEAEYARRTATVKL